MTSRTSLRPLRSGLFVSVFWLVSHASMGVTVAQCARSRVKSMCSITRTDHRYSHAVKHRRLVPLHWDPLVMRKLLMRSKVSGVIRSCCTTTSLPTQWVRQDVWASLDVARLVTVAWRDVVWLPYFLAKMSSPTQFGSSLRSPNLMVRVQWLLSVWAH